MAAAQMANRLAHEINNPLQSMTNAAYLVAEGAAEQDPRVLGRELSNDISRLDALMLVDDTGVIDRKAVNENATALYWKRCKRGTTHQIHGHAIIINDRADV